MIASATAESGQATLWWITTDPNTALALSILADGCAAGRARPASACSRRQEHVNVVELNHDLAGLV
ncbi:hypothetical protein SAMN05446589_8135 [Streptomyces sp. OV198]|uniref:hypothetical protein n=1 Tax=Streptomyces sp. OV198 TaxID=1882787 RepID=UPI000BD5EFB0|nr:hypothetical protein [Streptomyces sp. OV198]SOE78718.1 hypothetical protein SAMN05446589_8135 [Streptomyces sp. OV198]